MIFTKETSLHRGFILMLMGICFQQLLLAQHGTSLADQVNRIQSFSEENNNQLKAVSFFANIAEDEQLLHLEPDWQNGILLRADGSTLHFTGRFEVLHQTVEIFLDNQIRILSVAHVSLVKIGNRIMIPVGRNQVEGIGKDIYTELLFNGRQKLFAYYQPQSKKVSDGISKAAPGQTTYSFNVRYYVSDDLESFKTLPGKKRVVNELFADYSSEMAAYIDENKFRKNREDLIRLFHFYDQLHGEK